MGTHWLPKHYEPGTVTIHGWEYAARRTPDGIEYQRRSHLTGALEWFEAVGEDTVASFRPAEGQAS